VNGQDDKALDALASRLTRERALPPATARRLALCYGTEAFALAERGAEPLVPGSPILAAEVDWAVRVEGALSLEDVHYRRTRAALYHPEAREAGLAPTARHLARLLGWSPEREASELAGVRARMAADLAFRSAEAAA